MILALGDVIKTRKVSIGDSFQSACCKTEHLTFEYTGIYKAITE